MNYNVFYVLFVLIVLLNRTMASVEKTIRSFVILHLETTSLPNDRPVKITEISMVAAMREHILDFGNYTRVAALPRVISKLNICVYPRRAISQGSTDITHLSDELLQHQNPFDENLFNILDSFIKRIPQPVCIIAHNGLRFDFPVLQTELYKIGKVFPDHIMCADSLPGFRELLQSSKIEEACNGKVTAAKQVSIFNYIQPLNNGNKPQDKNRATNQECSELINPALKSEANGEVYNGKVTAAKPVSILNYIQPINDGNKLQYKNKATNQVCAELINPALKSEVNELHLIDNYDEALCSLLDDVEKSSTSESNTSMKIYFNDEDDLLCSILLDTVETVKVKDECKVTATSLPEEVNKNPMENEVSPLKELIEKTPDRPTTVVWKHPNPAAGDNCAFTPVSIRGKRNRLNTACEAKKRLNFSPEKNLQTKPKSFKLCDVYRFLLQRDPINGHQAESDALCLLECIIARGKKFTEWVDKNAIPFNSVKKLK